MEPWRPDRVAVFDFEYSTDPNGRPDPVCVVVAQYELSDTGGLTAPGAFFRIGWDEMRALKQSPWDTSPRCVSVAFSGHGDLSCMDALGWPRPARYIDLMTEMRWLLNGRPNMPMVQGLYSYLDRLGIPRPSAGYKADVRECIIDGRSADRKADVLDYCESDVVLTAELLDRVSPVLDWQRAIGHRGLFAQAMSLAEYRGLPVDVELVELLAENWDRVRSHVVRTVNAVFGMPIYDHLGTFKLDTLTTWLDVNGLLRGWRRTRNGAVQLDDDDLREWSKCNPALCCLYEARRVLSQGANGLRLDIGADGRCRSWFNIFGTKTGRNAPRAPSEATTRGGPFLFAGARWVRGLLKPAPGMGLAYLDWRSQEVFVAAVLSGDENLLACYYHPVDPYLGFAILAGAAPPDATKASHKAVRAKFKTTLLGLGYGMGQQALAGRLQSSVAEAGEMVRLHRKTFARYWEWSQRVTDHARTHGVIVNPAGWRMQVDGFTKPTTLGNWPVQSAAAAMLQTAVPMIERAGVRVLATVHDAVVIEAPAELIHEHTAVTDRLMRQAGQRLFQTDLECATDPKVVTWPDRFMDPDGEAMFRTILKALPTEKTRHLTYATGGVSF